MGARSGSERGSSKVGWFDNLPPGLTRTVELLRGVVDSSSPVVAPSSRLLGCRMASEPPRARVSTRKMTFHSCHGRHVDRVGRADDLLRVRHTADHHR